MTTFWRCWRSNKNKSCPVAANIDGAADDVEIAHKFADFVKVTSGNLSPNCNDGLDSNLVNHPNMYDCHDRFSVEDVDLGIRNNLKLVARWCNG